MDHEQNDLQKQKVQYLSQRRSQAMIVGRNHFNYLSQKYLSTIPIAGAAAFRLKDGTEGILISWDYYQSFLGEDFTDCIDYEIEHEAQELWLTRGKDKVDPLGQDHYEAIREVMKKTHQDGKLDRYMALKRKQFQTFARMGDEQAMKELEFYESISA